jgi:hypothetical protein
MKLFLKGDHVMFKRLFIMKKGEGVITGMLWMAVTSIVAGAIAYSIWAAVSTSSGTLKTLIQTTIH